MYGPRGSRSSSSITLRLTVLFAGSTFGILALSAGVLYWSLARSLRSEDSRILRENASLLEETLRRFADRPSLLRDEIEIEPSTRRLEPFYARVLMRGTLGAGENDGIETPGMGDLLPPERFTASTTAEPVVWGSPNGRTFLLYAPEVVGGPPGHLQVALDVTHDAVILARYRWILFGVLVLATVAASVAGLNIARRGLRPVDRIAAAMREITAARLDRRIEAAAWPEELADLTAVFDEMLDRLEESFARLSRFSADLAHELRTPLTNLRGEVEVTLGHVRSPEEYRRVMESNLEEYVRLTELIDRLLFLARAEAGASALELRLIDAGDEARAVLELYGPLAEEQRVEASCEGAAFLLADATLFRRAVANLLSNALVHTPAGGEVRVRIGERAGRVRVEVEDTGCGIPAEHLPRVTDRFYRVDAARSGGGGAGLGLSLVQTIMALHGGSLEIASAVGSGTIATLSFPAASRTPRAAASRAQPAGSRREPASSHVTG